MKPKSLLSLLAVLLCLLLMPARSNAQALAYVIGNGSTNSFYCRIYAAIDLGLLAYFFDLDAPGFSVTLVQGIELDNPGSLLGGKSTSTFRAATFYTDELFYVHPTLTTITFKVPDSGPTTVGYQIIDYFNQRRVLQSSPQVPITHGSITVFP